MSTLASQLGQHFMFQKFEQTMVNLIFDTMDLHYGIKLMRDLIHSKENYVNVPSYSSSRGHQNSALSTSSVDK